MGEEIVIQPVGYPEKNISFVVGENEVRINGLSEREVENGNVTYMLNTPLNTASPIISGRVDSDAVVDTSVLDSGIYVLSIVRDGAVAGTVKFTK